jgi:hypothetical protein
VPVRADSVMTREIDLWQRAVEHRPGVFVSSVIIRANGTLCMRSSEFRIPFLDREWLVALCQRQQRQILSLQSRTTAHRHPHYMVPVKPSLRSW